MHNEPTPYSTAYKRAVVLLLMTAYTFNAMDRSIISIVASSMKLDLKLTDTQVGLLGGTAFALLYAFGGIPIARLAERVSRVNIISVALIVWSTLSALCGAAGSFPQLLLIRVGVGVAEAGCSPPAHSLISDYIEPSRRTSALSIYTGGISLGYLLAAVAGGYAVQHWGWRAACVLVGLPGVAIAILIKVFIREPPRGYSEPRAGTLERPPLPPFSLRGDLRELRAVGAALTVDRPVLHMVLGVTIGAFAAYGFYAFVPPYFARVFGLDYVTIGVVAGLAGGAAVGIGIVAGGFVADALAHRDARWYALVPALGGIIAAPLYVAAILESDWRAAAALLSLAGFFQYASLGPTFGVVQNVVGLRRRATATALLYICLSVFALGGGPLFTGWAIDHFAQADFRAQGAQPSYMISCPGGAARQWAGAEIKSACKSTLSRATRRGMLATLVFFGWASLHYFIASAGIAKSLKSAALRNALA
ncbi:MAG TPA: MFS transporter [Steroidobacteraceae bacterium]|nr:MFS transporter [Steroidobacteraceae bacterium]